jgi:hypothetical protein
MLPLKHSVRRQTLKVRCDSQESALALRSRLSEYNRSNLLPVIERVLSETAIAGRQIRIGRLEVDLGTISLSEFEEVAGERLYRELKEAIGQAMNSPYAADSQSETLSQVELLECYLRRGVLPFWAPPGASFSLESSFEELARRDPAALARLVRQAGASPHVPERIVFQLTPGALRRLVSVLEPEHAALILAYIADLGEIHREQPIGPRDEVRFERLLWMLVLSYLIREAGSQFNRRSFVGSLIRGFAEHHGREYSEILLMLWHGLERTGTGHSLQSSLPAVIGELLDDSGLSQAERSESADLAGPDGSEIGDPALTIAQLAALAQTDLLALARLVRRYGTSAGWLENLVNALDENALFRLIGVLEPEHAEEIIILLFDIREVHRSEPVLSADPGRFDRILWLLTLNYLVRERGSQFNRKSFCLALIHRLAHYEGLDFKEVLRTLEAGLTRARFRNPLKSSLPAIIVELLEVELSEDAGREAAHDQAPMPAPAPNPFKGALQELLAVRAQPDSPPALRAAIERLAEGCGIPPDEFVELAWATLANAPGEAEQALREMLTGLLPRLPDPEATDQIGEYDLVAILRAWLDRGAMPWTVLLSDPALTPERALALLPGLPLPLIERVLARDNAAEQDQVIMAGLRRMQMHDASRLLSRLLPASAQPGTPLADALQEARARTSDSRALLAQVISAVLNERPLDFEQLTESVAAEAGAAGLTGPAGPRPLSDDPLKWDPAVLKSAIVAAPGPYSPAPEEQPGIPVLVKALLQHNPLDGRAFLGTVLKRAAFREVFVRRLTRESFQATLDLLAGPASRSLSALLEAFEALAPADRPSLESTRSLLLAETVHTHPIDETDPELFQRILRALFAVPLPARIRAALLASVAPEQRALRSVVETGLLNDPGPAHTAQAAVLPAEHLLDLLLDAAASEAQQETWIMTLETQLDEAPGAARSELLKRLANPRMRDRLVRILPESTLARLARFLEPGRHHMLLRAAAILTSAWGRAISGGGRESARQMLWAAVFEAITAGSPTQDRLVSTVFERFSRQLRAGSRASSADSDASAVFLSHARRLAEESGFLSLRAALDSRPSLTPSGPESARSNSTRPRVKATQQSGTSGDPIYLSNAGLALTAPFLPHLFSTLGMLEPDGKGRSQWRSEHSASRAVHLLQYLVDENPAAPEPLLVLNKVLCGIPSATPVEAGIEMTQPEREICDQLLEAVIANWTIISNTSAAGLRETFLQREGRLEYDGDKWKLQVQRKTLDVLVDQMPWSFKLVFHDWMPEPLHVTW